MTLEDIVYERLCVGCPDEKKCHEECTWCESYQRALVMERWNADAQNMYDYDAMVGTPYQPAMPTATATNGVDFQKTKKEPEAAATSPTQCKGENEMNDSLLSDYNINRRKMQVKKVNMGDFARLYLKGIYSDYKDEAFNVYYVVNTLYALKELEQKADAPKWLFDEIKDALFTKWSAMEIEVEDDA